ncbi:flagellar biosynthetic protein FliR [Zoogloea sp.]|jgi:flagellar biosynthetic protein FliR|uniref:flagellar biosynthetic protein FliR n=1 Tax=Zoogloea sp. TaxID=49181 RepID=UPI0037DA4919
MLTVTAAQLDAWLALFAFPLARVLGLIGAGPVFGNNSLPRRIKLVVGLAVGIGVAPAFPAATNVSLDSWAGLLILVEQTLIGIAMGLAMRVVFAALDLMGELISLQMGLSFATFFDPIAGGQTAVVAELLTLLATLIFLSLNGHLLMLDTLARSFEWLPIGSELHKGGWMVLVRSGAMIFAAGLLMALPVVTALLITNIALGILTRAAPQLNLFAIGFPITMTVGFGVLLLALGHLAPLLQRFYDMGFDTMASILRTLHQASPGLR